MSDAWRRAELAALEREGYAFGADLNRMQRAWSRRVGPLVADDVDAATALYFGYMRALLEDVDADDVGKVRQFLLDMAVAGGLPTAVLDEILARFDSGTRNDVS